MFRLIGSPLLPLWFAQVNPCKRSHVSSVFVDVRRQMRAHPLRFPRRAEPGFASAVSTKPRLLKSKYSASRHLPLSGNGGARKPRHRCQGINQSKTFRIPTTANARNRKTVARRSARATLLMLSEERRRSGFPSGPFSFPLTSRTSLPLASLNVDEVRCAPDGMEMQRTIT